jgi:iron complex outermembrane recepter protein
VGIRDQNPSSFAEALRYAPGVRSETFGADTRNDWFKIRLIALLSFSGLLSGLLSDGLARYFSWLSVGSPLIVGLWAYLRLFRRAK